MNGSQCSVADPEIWNRGQKGGAEPPAQKILAKIMHFCAKFQLVLICIRSIGGGGHSIFPPPLFF